jgi:hypothetical protein
MMVRGPLRSRETAAWANVLRRALGVLWLADGLVKISIRFGGRAADQAYEQIMTAMTSVPGLHRFLAWERACSWLVRSLVGDPRRSSSAWAGGCSPARRAAGTLAASAGWVLVVWVAAEDLGGPFGGGRRS